MKLKEGHLVFELTDPELLRAWDMAINEVNSKAKKPEHTEGQFLARCWSDGIFRALLSSGYSICLKKNNTEIVLSPGSSSVYSSSSIVK